VPTALPPQPSGGRADAGSGTVVAAFSAPSNHNYRNNGAGFTLMRSNGVNNNNNGFDAAAVGQFRGQQVIMAYRDKLERVPRLVLLSPLPDLGSGVQPWGDAGAATLSELSPGMLLSAIVY